MIVTVCADKGSPGVSTTATLLGLVWPGERLLLEADPAGGDAALRLHASDGGLLGRSPSLSGLCVDVRGGLPPAAFGDYAQPSSLGLPVIAAIDMRSEDLALVAGQWPAVARAAAGWPGTVIADVGRLQADNPAGALAAASDLVLLVARPTPAGLLHLRERAASLLARLGQGAHRRSPLAVALICPAREHASRLAEARALLAADPATCAVPVAGAIVDDGRAVADLDAGVPTARLVGSDLIASAGELAGALLGGWPALTAGLDTSGEAAPRGDEQDRVPAPTGGRGDAVRDPAESAKVPAPQPVSAGHAVPAAAASAATPLPVGTAAGPAMNTRGWS